MGYIEGVVPTALKTEIVWHEDKSIQLRLDNDLTFHIYLPELHPFIKTDFFKYYHYHKLLEWTDINTKKRELLYILEIKEIMDIRDILSEYNLSEKIQGRYIHIKTLHIRSDSVIRLSGISLI